MKIVMISNYVSPHVSEICDVLYHAPGVVFHFIALGAPESFRTAIGFVEESHPYVVDGTKDPSHSHALLNEADFVIVGSADPSWLKNAIKAKKFIFRWNEHLDKGQSHLWLHKIHLHGLYAKESRGNGYLLCCSSHARSDFESSGLYKHKCFAWGYFPAGNASKDFSKKTIGKSAVLNILWSGRLLNWKHPEKALEAASILYQQKIPFSLRVLGGGELKESLKNELVGKPYASFVKIEGTKSYSETLEAMAEADIFLATSDKGEGWGAVLNEAMSSQCAVLASSGAGSTGFLVEDGQNGFVYQNDEEFQKKFLLLAKEPQKSQAMALQARQTILEDWNASHAVSNLLEVFKALEEKRPIPQTLKGAGRFID
jgi:glycosyltransferase involved in cell wall biosynthesis